MACRKLVLVGPLAQREGQEGVGGCHERGLAKDAIQMQSAAGCQAQARSRSDCGAVACVGGPGVRRQIASEILSTAEDGRTEGVHVIGRSSRARTYGRKRCIPRHAGK